MERVGSIICDSQSDYKDGARKQHILEKRTSGAAAAIAADLAEVDFKDKLVQDCFGII